MPLKTFNVENISEIIAEQLTPESFLPYGGVISADHQIKNVQSSQANYGTAIKIHKVAPIINNYKNCPSGEKETANWNIFRCTAPKHLFAKEINLLRMEWELGMHQWLLLMKTSHISTLRFLYTKMG